MSEQPRGKEYLPAPVQLDPTKLYTGEGSVYAQGLAATQNSQEPILFGKDCNGLVYVTDGNHRAYNALIHGTPLWGQQVSQAKFDVTKDSDFRLVSALRVVDTAA